jgi:hypothetical protein
MNAAGCPAQSGEIIAAPRDSGTEGVGLVAGTGGAGEGAGAGPEPDAAGGAGVGAEGEGAGFLTGGADEAGKGELSPPAFEPSGIVDGGAGRLVCEKK